MACISLIVHYKTNNQMRMAFQEIEMFTAIKMDVHKETTNQVLNPIARSNVRYFCSFVLSVGTIIVFHLSSGHCQGNSERFVWE